MDQIIYVGIGLFVLVLVLSLTYQGYAQANSQLSNTYLECNTYSNVQECSTVAGNVFFGNAVSPVSLNFTKYGGPLPNTYAGALQLAVFALVFIAVILAVVGALRGGTGTSGGFLR